LKSETRILLTTCSSRACVGIIVRGSGIDGSVGGKDCGELCKDFLWRGYRGETRFASGTCTCGLPAPPLVPSITRAWMRILSEIISDISLYLEKKPGGYGNNY